MVTQTCVALRWLWIVIAVLLIGWLTLRSADAVIGQPAPDITNPTWLNSELLPLDSVVTRCEMM